MQSLEVSELLHKVVTICFGAIACLDGMGYVLFWIFFAIELLKFWWLVTHRHLQLIDPLSVGLSISERRFWSSLVFDST